MFEHLFNAIIVSLTEKRMVVLIHQSGGTEKMQETVPSHLNAHEIIARHSLQNRQLSE